MGKTLKYGSHDFPTSFGFTGSSGSGPVKVRSHTRTRAAPKSSLPSPATSSERIPPRGVMKNPAVFDARRSTGESVLPSGVMHSSKAKAAFGNTPSGGENIAPAGKLKSVNSLARGGKLKIKVKKGALHEELGIAKDAPISSKRLSAAKSKAKHTGNKKLLKRVVFAENARKWNHADGGAVTRPEVKKIADREVAVHNRNPNAHPNMAGGGRVRKRNYDTGGAVPSAVPLVHGNSAYQGSSVDNIDGQAQQTDRAVDVYGRGSAPMTKEAIAAAISNAMGLMGGLGPIETAMATGLERATGSAPGSLGGIQDVPGYVGPNPAGRTAIASGKALLGSQQAADRAASMAAREGTSFGGGTGNTSVAGGPSVGGLAIGNDGRVAGGIRRGGAIRKVRGFNGKPLVGVGS